MPAICLDLCSPSGLQRLIGLQAFINIGVVTGLATDERDYVTVSLVMAVHRSSLSLVSVGILLNISTKQQSRDRSVLCHVKVEGL